MTYHAISDIHDPLLHANNRNSENTLDAADAEYASIPHVASQQIRTRLLDRDAAFYQSRGRWSIHHQSTGIARRRPLAKLIWDDWFHALIYQKTRLLLFILFLTYTGSVFAFAIVYRLVSWAGEIQKINEDGSISRLAFCDLAIHDKMEALYFSLSTMTTIGYGVSDYYFGGCWTPFLLVLAQVCCAITFDAVAIGVLFQRISRGHKRGKTILFSNVAAIRNVKGVPYFMFRVGELRKHQLLEATIQTYCIRHERHFIAGSNTGMTINLHHHVQHPWKQRIM
jgi:hypothetical protein